MIKWFNRKKLQSSDSGIRLTALEACVRHPDPRAAKLIEDIVLSEAAACDKKLRDISVRALAGVLDHVQYSTIEYCLDKVLGEGHPSFGLMLNAFSGAYVDKRRSDRAIKLKSIFENLLENLKHRNVSPQDPIACAFYIIWKEMPPSEELAARTDANSMTTVISSEVLSTLSVLKTSPYGNRNAVYYRDQMMACLSWASFMHLSGTAEAIAKLCGEGPEEFALEAAKVFPSLASPDIAALIIPLLDTHRYVVAMKALHGSRDKAVLKALHAWVKDYLNLELPQYVSENYKEKEEECLTALASCGAEAVPYLLDLLKSTFLGRNVIQVAEFHLCVLQHLTAFGWSPDDAMYAIFRFSLNGMWGELRKDGTPEAIALLIIAERTPELIALGDKAVPILAIAKGGYIGQHRFAQECLVQINSEAAVRALCSWLSQYTDEDSEEVDDIFRTQNAHAIPYLVEYLRIHGPNFREDDKEKIKRLFSKFADLISKCGTNLDMAILHGLASLPDIVTYENKQIGYDPEGPGTAWYSASYVTYDCSQIRNAAKLVLHARGLIVQEPLVEIESIKIGRADLLRRAIAAFEKRDWIEAARVLYESDNFTDRVNSTNVHHLWFDGTTVDMIQRERSKLEKQLEEAMKSEE